MPSPRFSTAVVEDLSDAVYTQTGVMGLVRLTSNVRLSATISSDGGTEMGGPKGMGGLLASLGKGSPSARRRSLTQPGERAQNERRSQLGPESLDLLAMYVPDLVLRQFSSGLDGRKPPPTGAFSEPLRGALLFADISGFTGLTQQLQASDLGPARGAEELNKVLSDYFSLLIRCFHKHGGDVVSFSGDAMTVLFEARPVASSQEASAASGSGASGASGGGGGGDAASEGGSLGRRAKSLSPAAAAMRGCAAESEASREFLKRALSKDSGAPAPASGGGGSARTSPRIPLDLLQLGKTAASPPPPCSQPPPDRASTPPDGSPAAALAWLPAAVRGEDEEAASLARAALRAAACSLEMLQQVSSFSVEAYTAYGVAVTPVSLHAAMGAGDLIGVHVHGDTAGDVDQGEPLSPPTAHRSGSRARAPARPAGRGGGGALPRSAERRDGFALMGGPITQLRAAEKKAGDSEVVLSPECWALLAPHCDGAVDADGFARLRSVRKSAHSRMWKEAQAEATAVSRDASMLWLERSAAVAARLAAYIPEPVQYRMRTAGMNWLADFRLATILFVRITTLSPDYVSPGMFPAGPVADADNIHQSGLSTSQRITHHALRHCRADADRVRCDPRRAGSLRRHARTLQRRRQGHHPLRRVWPSSPPA